MLQSFSLPGRSFRRMAQELAFLPGWHCAGQIAAFLRVFRQIGASRKARAVNEWTCPAESVAWFCSSINSKTS